MYDILELNKKLLPELKEIAKSLNIKKVENFKKQELIYKILDQQAINASLSNEDEKSKDSRKPLRKPEKTVEVKKEEPQPVTPKSEEPKPAEANEQLSRQERINDRNKRRRIIRSKEVRKEFSTAPTSTDTSDEKDQIKKNTIKFNEKAVILPELDDEPHTEPLIVNNEEEEVINSPTIIEAAETNTIAEEKLFSRRCRNQPLR